MFYDDGFDVYWASHYILLIITYINIKSDTTDYQKLLITIDTNYYINFTNKPDQLLTDMETGFLLWLQPSLHDAESPCLQWCSQQPVTTTRSTNKKQSIWCSCHKSKHEMKVKRHCSIWQGLVEHLSSPSRSGWSPAAKQHLVHFGLKKCFWWEQFSAVHKIVASSHDIKASACKKIAKTGRFLWVLSTHIIFLMGVRDGVVPLIPRYLHTNPLYQCLVISLLNCPKSPFKYPLNICILCHIVTQ